MTSNQLSAATQQHIEDYLRRAFPEKVDALLPKQFEAPFLQLKRDQGMERTDQAAIAARWATALP